MNTRKTLVRPYLPLTFLLALWLNGCFLARQLAPAGSPDSTRTENPETIYGPVPGKIPGSAPIPNPNPGPTPDPIPATSEASLRRNITDYARNFIGTRYTSAGKQPSTGFDCSGFTNFVLSAYGYPLAASARQQAQQGREIPLALVQPGDLIFYQRNAKDGIFHVSVVVENTGKEIRVIHSTTSRGVIVEDILASSYWKPFIFSARDVLSQY
jgi:cell wall-associated NlpC family hydrolase